MIDIKSLSPAWLANKQDQYRKDPSIIESMIHALYLLEQLKLTGLNFVFKGGTSLLLIMEHPSRFSVDIDIVVKPEMTKEQLEKHLNRIVDSSAFIKMELDEKRSYKEGIPKAHYKFKYNSNVPALNKAGAKITNPERDILLDVLFIPHRYPVLLERPIETEWILTTGAPSLVTTPDIDSITGDKLTAFGPNTIGVPYGVEKEKEIMKQLYDIGILFDMVTDLSVVKKAFAETAKIEISYHEGNPVTIEEVLNDNIATGLILARKENQAGDDERNKYAELARGINQFGHYVYKDRFRIDEAQVASAKAAYLASLILKDVRDKLKKFDEKIPLADYTISHPDFNFLNKRLKFVSKGEGLFYWNETINLLHPPE